jgi:multidrug efflux pump subunit AcrA (membrane-fusion protein)
MRTISGGQADRRTLTRPRASALAAADPPSSIPGSEPPHLQHFPAIDGLGAWHSGCSTASRHANVPVSTSSTRSTVMRATNIGKQVIHDKIDSQVKTVQARLETLKAKAETAKANAEIKLIADLLAKKKTIDQKLAELRTSAGATYNQAKSDVESRVAELEASVRGIEARFSA